MLTLTRVLAAVGASIALLSAGCAQHDEAAGTGPPGPRAVYVTNWASNEISAFGVEADGSLRPGATVTPVVAGSANPQGSVRSRDGRWLYVANWGSSDLGTYRIADDGALASPVRIPAAAPTPVTPSALALTPDGHNLYMANFSNGAEGTVSHFAVDADGIPRGVSTISAHGAGTTSLTVSPDGRTLLTANMSSGDASSFAIGTAGEPSWVATVATGGGAFVPAITPTGDRALVTNSTADSVSLLSLGRDSQIAVVATVVNPAREPRGVVIDAAGGHAYVANFAGGTGPGAITTFAIRAGELVPIGEARPTGSNGAEGIALAADGETLYVANFNTDGDGSVTGFPVVPDGSLGEPHPPLRTGGRQPDLSSITVPDP